MSNVRMSSKPALRGDEEGAGDSAGRAREHAVDRVAGRLARRHQARVGAQDVDLGLRADRRRARSELLDVGRTFGRTYEFMHAVSARSYSRNSGRTSDESVTGKPG